MTTFYDSARWGLIPEGSAALLYGDGRYEASEEDAKRFRAVRWITVFGSSRCGAADYEPGNTVYRSSALNSWVQARREMGCRARIYTDLASLGRAHYEVGSILNVRWWIATLDGQQRTAAEMVELARDKAGVTLYPDTIWAQQWKGGPSAPYDESVLLGEW